MHWRLPRVLEPFVVRARSERLHPACRVQIMLEWGRPNRVSFPASRFKALHDIWSGIRCCAQDVPQGQS